MVAKQGVNTIYIKFEFFYKQRGKKKKAKGKVGKKEEDVIYEV